MNARLISSRSWNRYASVAAVVAVVAVTHLAGCGAVDPDATGAAANADKTVNARTAEVAEGVCSRAPFINDAGTIIVLDWTGGVSAVAPGRTLTAFDFDALNFAVGPDAGLPDDLHDTFRRDVLARVTEMLCVLDPLDIAVVEGEQEDFPNASIVHFTGDLPASMKMITGQSEWDPCDEYIDDAAVVWGGTLSANIRAATYDEWVLAVSNVAVHEIGHTLGFAHPDEETLARSLPVPAEEVMRATVRASDLLLPKGFLFPQDTCPTDGSDEVTFQLIEPELVLE